MDKQQLLSLDLLKIKAPDGGFYMGGAQHWFRGRWKRMSGCGPTTAAGMLRYLARSRRCPGICDVCAEDTSSFLKFMDMLFKYITPRMIGVNVSTFEKGIARYGGFCGVNLKTRALNIPLRLFRRPATEELRDFILEALNEDLPLAFLNYSNGSLNNLTGWHWVMIVGLEPGSMTATICDCGGVKEIGLGEWLKTSVLGGGVVSIYFGARAQKDEK